MKKILITLSSLVLALASAHLNAAPLGTAFTYQGRLTDGANPANGTIPMVFGLWDADLSGNNLGSPSSISANVPVANGLFTIDLDFGTTAFSGDARWLEIRVNGTLMTSRQRVAPTPHALYASTAGSVKSGAIQATQLGTVGASASGQVLTYNGSSLFWQTPSGSSLWSLSGNSDAYYNAGKVGVGTTTPGQLFQVGDNTTVPGSQGMIRLASRSSTSGANRYWDIGVPTAAGDPSGQSYSYVIDDPQTGSGPELMIRWDSGNVGIGTTNPGAKLHVSQVGNSGVGVFAGDRAPFGSALFQTDVTTPGTHVWFAENGNRVFSVEAGGHLTAVRGAEFAGNWDSGQVALELSGEKPTIKFTGDGASDYKRWLIHLGSDGPGDLEFFRTSFADELTGIPPRRSMTLSRDGLNVAASASVCTLTIRGGCDVAEPFPMKEVEIEKGSVVVIDEEHPGQLKLSTRVYDTRVAGIVSGANGINPGIALHQEGVIEGGQNVSLSGRVYVRADASSNPINPGDLLTTSNTPGHAMKATDQAKAQGAIIGKAMSALKEGKGMVLVLVSLQ